jgi:hypothetical protein
VGRDKVFRDSEEIELGDNDEEEGEGGD